MPAKYAPVMSAMPKKRSANVAHQQCERNRINRDAAVLVPFLLHLEECLVHDQADDRNEYEERYNAGQNEQRAYRRIGQRAQNGQDDDAQNIVDNGPRPVSLCRPAFSACPSRAASRP